MNSPFLSTRVMRPSAAQAPRPGGDEHELGALIDLHVVGRRAEADAARGDVGQLDGQRRLAPREVDLDRQADRDARVAAPVDVALDHAWQLLLLRSAPSHLS